MLLLGGEGQWPGHLDDGVLTPGLETRACEGLKCGIEGDEFLKRLPHNHFIEVRFERRIRKHVVLTEKSILGHIANSVRRERLWLLKGGIQHRQLGILSIGCFRDHSYRGYLHKVLRVAEQRSEFRQVLQHHIAAAGTEGAQGTIAEAWLLARQQSDDAGHDFLFPSFVTLG